MSLLIKNIKELVQVEYQPHQWIAGRDMARLESISDAYLIIDGENISSFGRMKDLGGELESKKSQWRKLIDASGKMVFPSWCDSHTHLVFPASPRLNI